MRGDVDGDALIIHLAPVQQAGKGVQPVLRAGHGAELRRVDRGDVQIVADQIFQLGRGQRYAEHPAGGHGIEQPPAQQHQVDAVFERHHTGQRGGGVFAHRMTD